LHLACQRKMFVISGLYSNKRMNIYTDELSQELQEKFKINPHGDPFSLYNFVCSPQLKPVRNRIESWIDEFPELSSEKNFIRPFISAKSHKQAISELVVGVALKKLGFSVEHNKLFNGKTPDWYAHGKDDIPHFVIEATTINPHPSQQAISNKMDDFFNSIRKLGIGVTLKITKVNENAESNFHSKQKKQSVKSIEMWLKTKPLIGAKHQAVGFQFEIEEWKKDADAMTTKGIERSFTIDPTLFANRIKEKVKKYKSIIESNNLIFWVAIQTDERVGLTLDKLKEILSGRRESLSQAETKLPVEQIRQILSPANKGLFEEFPLLSGVIWIGNDFYQNYWNLIPLYNSFAKNKLSPNALREIRFLPHSKFLK
jgi:hypothetical protein